MNGVQVRNVLGYIGCPTITIIEASHVPGDGIGRIPTDSTVTTESEDGGGRRDVKMAEPRGISYWGGCYQVVLTKKLE